MSYKSFAADTDLLAKLHLRVRKSTAKAVAAELGVSAAYLGDVLMGRRGISERIASELGYERTWGEK